MIWQRQAERVYCTCQTLHGQIKIGGWPTNRSNC